MMIMIVFLHRRTQVPVPPRRDSRDAGGSGKSDEKQKFFRDSYLPNPGQLGKAPGCPKKRRRPKKLSLPSTMVYSIIGVENEGEVTELVPVPDFKSAVTVREYGEVSSILMLSRQFLF